MNETMFRIRCDKCGRLTLTPIIMDASELLTVAKDGRQIWLRLCPEHKAEWQRLISDFLEGSHADR